MKYLYPALPPLCHPKKRKVRAISMTDYHVSNDKEGIEIPEVDVIAKWPESKQDKRPITDIACHARTGQIFLLSPSNTYIWTTEIKVLRQTWFLGSSCAHQCSSTISRFHVTTTMSILQLTFQHSRESQGKGVCRTRWNARINSHTWQITCTRLREIVENAPEITRQKCDDISTTILGKWPIELCHDENPETISEDGKG